MSRPNRLCAAATRSLLPWTFLHHCVQSWLHPGSQCDSWKAQRELKIKEWGFYSETYVILLYMWHTHSQAVVKFDFNILLFMVLCGKSQIFIPALSPNLREMVFKLVVVFALITSHKTMQYILIWLTLTNFYGVNDCSQDCDFMPFTKGAGSPCQTEQVVGYWPSLSGSRFSERKTNWSMSNWTRTTLKYQYADSEMELSQYSLARAQEEFHIPSINSAISMSSSLIHLILC